MISFSLLLLFIFDLSQGSEKCPKSQQKIHQVLRDTDQSLNSFNGQVLKEDELIQSENYLSSFLKEGRRTLILKNGRENDIFEAQGLFNLLKNNPQYAQKLGISQRLEKGQIILEYPDIAALNKIIDELQKSNDPWAPQFKFRLFQAEEEVPVLDYIRSLAQGEVPVTHKGRHYFHDLGVHLTGWSYTTKEVKEAITSRFNIYLEILENPKLKRLEKEVKHLVEHEVEFLDQMNANLNYRITTMQYTDNIVSDLVNF